MATCLPIRRLDLLVEKYMSIITDRLDHYPLTPEKKSGASERMQSEHIWTNIVRLEPL